MSKRKTVKFSKILTIRIAFSFFVCYNVNRIGERIMEKERNNNGNTILLTVIGVATLLVALVGATFAYFSATINNEQAESIILQTATPVGLKYKGGTLALDNIVPGDSKEGTFTVENPARVGETSTPNKVQQTYDLKLIVDKNELTTEYRSNENKPKPTDADSLLQDQLRVYLSSAKTTAGTKADGTTPANTTMKPIAFRSGVDGSDYYNLTSASATAGSNEIVIVDDQQIAIGETHTYSIRVEFVNLEIPQDANQGKAFEAHIEISDTKSVKES